MTDTTSPTNLPDELDARQEAVIAQLDQLNDRIELVLHEVLRQRQKEEVKLQPRFAPSQ